MRSEEAYLHFLERLRSHGEGVFWSCSDQDRWAFGVGEAKKVDFDDSVFPLFAMRSFLGDLNYYLFFETYYSNVLEVFPEKKDFPVPRRQRILNSALASYTKMSCSVFCEKIRAVQDLQRNGDMWVLNLSHRLEGDVEDVDGFLNNFYFFLKSGRSRIGGVVWTKDLKFISFSPETFLLEASGVIRSFPIKGTGRKKDLEGSLKEQAELAMITDLMRNDLSRIGTSVQVDQQRCIRDEVDFFHSYSAVSAQLMNPVLMASDFSKLLPAGSVSGAPKVRVVEEILKQESCSRSFYTGTFGVRFSEGGSFFNILIRTLFFSKDLQRWFYPVGAGITLDSVPEKEWKETLKKAEILKHFF